MNYCNLLYNSDDIIDIYYMINNNNNLHATSHSAGGTAETASVKK